MAVAQGSQNIGFALPINNAKKDLVDLKKYGKLKQPFLGVRYVLVHISDYKNNENLLEKKNIENIEKNRGLNLVRRFEDVAVYEVGAKPTKPNIQ